MDLNDFTIRPARLDESDLLSHIRFRARSYWDYPRETLNYWLESGELSISPEEIEVNPTYVAEDEEGEVMGFYSIRIFGSECEIKCLCVLPEFLGAGLRSTLFFHACEIAESAGAISMTVLSDPFSSSFYEEMGAERTDEVSSPGSDCAMSVLRLNLQATD
jgi:N-acetylglutamate synthase-like GNAT family acetyltransferase